jgi:D-alanyl-lipoteichoic acid acyltransferase DltB (MBOAT superfamily)
MLFNSINYLLFLSVVTLVYYLFPPRQRWLWILPASYYFYACWNVKFILLLLFSTGLNFLVAIWIESIPSQHRKILLFWGIFINLSVLIVFKYLNFVTENFNELFSWLSLNQAIPKANLILPIAISFDTFRMISYLVDVYRGELRKQA